MAERIILSPKIKCAEWKKRTGLWNQGVIGPSHGPWYYFTAEDGQIDWDKGDFVLISTLEGFEKISRFYGADQCCLRFISRWMT